MATKDDDTNIKVTDFGLSKVVGEDQLMKTLCGTPQYLVRSLRTRSLRMHRSDGCPAQAPEILEKKDGKLEGYSKAVDLWSMGVLLYILWAFSILNPLPCR